MAGREAESIVRVNPNPTVESRVGDGVADLEYIAIYRDELLESYDSAPISR